MKFGNIFGLLTFFILCSCFQRTSKSRGLDENLDNSEVKLESQLIIDNGINRGISYTDPLGTDYSIRNIPIRIKNDSTIPVQIHINFSRTYNHPNLTVGEKFNLIPLPTEWGLEHTDITESMLDEIPKLIEKPYLKATIEPGNEIILSIGSIYPRPAKSTGVLPRTLFVQNDSTILSNCERYIEVETTISQQIPLRLKTIFGEQCMIIPCGYISYVEQ